VPGTSRSAPRALRLVAATSALLVLLAALAACSSDGSADGADDSVPEAVGGDGSTAALPFGPDGGVRTSATSDDGELTIESSSTRAEMVSGGDVLVTISGPAADGDDAPTVSAGDDDVSGRFEQDEAVAGLEDGTVWRGLVTGLPDGETEITAEVGDQQATLDVTSHPTSGPIFSGPHLEPWVCTTEQTTLGEATDEDCSAEPVTTWQYQTTEGELAPLEDPTITPPDVDTVELDGEQVPVIIRTELAVIDRGIATIWTLDPAPDPDGEWDRTGWNERLVYRFGGGCGTQYSQGSNLGPSLDVDLLLQGYAVATNTLDTFQTACNDVLSAEAALMTREHFVEQYGVPRFTIGDGGSGGAIQQLLIANAHPGLLDALAPSAPFPDAITISGGVTDCGLLLSYYETESGRALTDEQRAAINGHATAATCVSWSNLFLDAVDPTAGCRVDADEVYDPETNPDGVRCTLQDINVNVLGTDPDTGFARRPLANEGVQYGLQALTEGTITVEQFLDLNEQVGGYDIDGTIVDERTDADEAAVTAAYETGRVTGAGPLLDVPIILRNGYTDDAGDIHTRFHVFSIRERLQVDGEDDPNLLLWSTGGNVAQALLGSISDNEPIVLLDEWLTAAHDDGRDVPWRERLTDARPDDATNRCLPPDTPMLTGGWELYDEPGPCTEAFPSFGDSRTAAGAPLADDVLACQLVPVEHAVAAGAYPVELADAAVQRLEATFPDGVCDWSQPGIGQGPPVDTWIDYSEGPHDPS
jgi:hypothetical protein